MALLEALVGACWQSDPKVATAGGGVGAAAGGQQWRMPEDFACMAAAVLLALRVLWTALVGLCHTGTALRPLHLLNKGRQTNRVKLGWPIGH